MTGRPLSPVARLAWLAINVALGLAPSLLFAAWIERNMALPRVPIELHWPWVDLAEASLGARVAWNSLLYAGFAVLHSALAQPFAARALQRFGIPAPAQRSFYLAVTGVSLLLLMALWQSTGIVAWVVPLAPHALLGVSLALFWGFLLLGLLALLRLRPSRFVGWEQLAAAAPAAGAPDADRLITDGIYGRIRHPLYLCLLLAIVATPFMTLDRLLLFTLTCAYLAVGIPIEERKLVSAFGEPFLAYRKRVPALLPRLRFWG